MKHLPTVWLLGVLALPALAQKGPEDALAALKAGNQRFAQGQSTAQPLGEGVRRSLARGQSPFAIVLCCADSRVPPEHVFNAGLGELFVVRVAGNVVDPEDLASVEYAAEHLGAQLCVVLGHERCGAVAACIQTVQQASAGKPAQAESPAIAQLLQALEPAVRTALGKQLGGKELNDCAEEENAQEMAVAVLQRSPLLQKLQRAGRFQVTPARYHLDSGVVDWLPMRPLSAASEPTAKGGHASAPNVAPHVALRFLQAGHRRFLGDGKALGDISPKRREALTSGQQPMAIVVTCADSRLAPEHIFDAGLGELFVIRVAGNVLNDDVLASIEYAAAHTGAPLVLVMGHSSCGAVKAAIEHGDDPSLTPNLRALVDRITPAVEQVRGHTLGAEDLVAQSVRANVLRFCSQVRRQSTLLHHLEEDGRFAVVPAVYDLATGDIEWLKDDAEHGSDDSHATEPAPHGAPAGEAKPKAAPHGNAHGGEQGHDEHAETNGHGEPAHGAPAEHGHGGDEHGEHAAQHGDDEHAAPAHGETAHDEHAAHGEPAGHGGGDLSWVDDAAHGDEAAAHSTEGAPHEAAATTGHGAQTAGEDKWLRKDQALMIGAFGISSLVLGAFATFKKRAA